MKIKIGVIIASTRPVRLGPSVAKWFLSQIDTPDNVEIEVIDLAKINLPFLNEPNQPADAKYENESTKKWSQTVDNLDGFIFVIPEYNHGYPAPLKNALDTIYKEWRKKPVAFVGYGVLGAARSIDHLIPALAQIGLVSLPYVAINIINAENSIDSSGNIKPDSIKGSKPSRLLEELIWWTKLLKTARTET